MNSQFDGYMPATLYARQESKKNRDVPFYVIKVFSGGVKYRVMLSVSKEETPLAIFMNGVIADKEKVEEIERAKKDAIEKRNQEISALNNKTETNE